MKKILLWTILLSIPNLSWATKIIESFSSQEFYDPASTAIWNNSLGYAHAPITVNNDDTSNGASPSDRINFGDGSEGNCVISGSFVARTFNCVNVTIQNARPTGNNPIIIRALGKVTISGTLNLSGGNGQSAATAGGGGPRTGGIGIAGGKNGADSLDSSIASDGNAGTDVAGNGGGGGGGYGDNLGIDAGGGGGGGGSIVGGTVTAGGNGNGGGNGFGGAAGGSALSNDNIIGPFYTGTDIGGAGGGSGGRGETSTSTFFSGAGGGAGGGSILISAASDIILNGSINTDGGDGGDSSSLAGAGGGGSGGVIVLQTAAAFINNGSLFARGGSGGSAAGDAGPGGNGGPGIIRIDEATANAVSTTNMNPVPSYVGAPAGTSSDVDFVTGNTEIISLGYDTRGLLNQYLSYSAVSELAAGDTITYEFSESTDNAAWSGWTPTITTLVGQRYIRFRAIINTTNDELTSKLKSLTINYEIQQKADYTFEGQITCGTISDKNDPNYPHALLSFCFAFIIIRFTKIKKLKRFL
ncbi:MAG: hypothetical protein JNM93_00110 [Bacteriovoracaceae bacterium]|nr:hypothetical protein [Bacteriovoracaceae bacterium]